MKKLKWFLGISLVFFLIIATNLIDKDNFTRIRNSVTTIHNDRVVANGLIFKLTELLHEKEIAYLTKDAKFFTGKNSAQGNKIDSILITYQGTELTEQEKHELLALKSTFDKIRKAEAQNPTFLTTDSNYKNYLETSKNNLRELTRIQLAESKRQLKNSENVMDSVELFTRLEIYALVLIAIILQIIVIYNPKNK